MQNEPVITAWVWSISVMAVLFLINLLIANMVMYRPNDPGTTTRRLWFWVLAVLSLAISFGINLYIADDIKVHSSYVTYLMHAGIAALVVFVLYVGLGFVLSKLFPNSKIGTWF
ncbi:MAG: hypothetical protein ACI4AM_00620 [Muribaculaceae bacterium]